MNFDFDFFEDNNAAAAAKSHAHKSTSWLVSYGDLITQLLVFFIILVSVSKVSAAKLEQMQSSLQGEPVAENPLKKIHETLEAVLAKHGLQKSVDVTQEFDGITMVIKDSLLFGSGESNISAQAAQKLEPILGALQDLPGHYRFSIEGHTDDTPFQIAEYANNWQLSSDRAIAVLELFVARNFDPHRLSVHGYGEYQPLAPNKDAKGQPIYENQSKNRRVVIRVR